VAQPFLALLSAGGSATDAFARGRRAAFRTVLSLPPQSWAPCSARVGHRQSGGTALAVVLVVGAAIAIEPPILKGGRAR
jgi:hypothetical protein